MRMNDSFKRIPLSILKNTLFRTCRMLVTAILLMAVCLSSVSPITPVSSSDPEGIPGSQLQVDVDVCMTPVISTDTTWTSGNVYLADCIVTVSAGVTLTVEAGAVVRFGGSGRGLKVLGTLNVTGSEGNPAVFTSLNDDPANSWYGIVMYENSSANLDYASIRYAGSGVCAGGYEDSSYNNCYNRAQLDVRRADLTLNHSEIRNGHVDGVVLDTPGRTPSIQNTTVSNNTNGNPDDMVGLAIYQSSINMQPTYSNLTFSGNDRNKVIIWIPNPDYSLTQNVVLGGAPIGFGCGFTSCVMQIPNETNLTIQPGSVLDMTTVSSGFRVLSGGTLLLGGTELDPVSIIRGFVEVAFGGVADLNYCDLDEVDSVYYGLYVRSDDVTVSNCAFHDYVFHGIYAYAESGNALQLEMTNVDVLDNLDDGIHIGTSSSATFDLSLEGGTISGSGDNGITVGGGPASLALKDVVISGNGITGFDGSERNGVYATVNNVSLILENVQFNNNVNESLYWNCNGSITARNLSASGNTRNALALAGCALTTGREWDLAEAGIPVVITNSINVNSGGVVSITPGTTLGFEPGKYLWVNQDGALYALGTADYPIVFSRAYDTQTGPTAWGGLKNEKGTMILRHCDVSYSNFDSPFGAEGYGLILGSSSTTPPTNSVIQNCKIHDNDIGISAVAPTSSTTSILYNEIYDNPTLGVKNAGYGPEAINAYYNYWGDPTGPYNASLNPGGLGNPVGNNVNFNPFLTTPPEDQTLVGEMWVSSAGPSMISPGEVNDYAIQYLNLTADPIYDAVAVIQLPLAGTYVSSTEGGTYWPGRHQVFWVLGDIAPGTQGMLTARVRYDWGLAASYRDGSFTMLSGTNYKPDELNRDDYKNYTPDDISSILRRGQADFDTWRASNPDLETLYSAAVAEGFAFIEASETSFDGGRVVKTALLRTADKTLARMLNLSSSGVVAITTDGSTFFKIEDLAGGQLTNLLTLERSTWGAWADAEEPGSIQADCNYARCMRNCSLKTITIEMMKDTAKAAGTWLFGLPVAAGLLGSALLVYEVVTRVADVYVCHEGCSSNPLAGCCNPGDVLWSPSFIGGSSRCEKYECGFWNSFPAAPNTIEVCGEGTRCVAGNDGYGGCKPCTEDGGFLNVVFGPQMVTPTGCSDDGVNANTPKCSDLGIRVAKDPNAIYGPLGDVLPEQIMDYRITCENEGAGDAYGVYILNELPAQLDESTLVINNGGVYVPAERQIFWYIGELGPKGDPTSEAEVTYSAQLKSGLEIGTAVVNQATVYFPSVPEETPTNTWVNVIYPLTATPMQLETDYMTPLEFALEGRPAGSLTFNLETLPFGGTLEGELPNLTYTPVENFIGTDFFTFKVSFDGETSQIAQVTIDVSTSGDETSPSVLWVMPEDQETDVEYSSTPIYKIPEGDVYPPVIVAKLSEKIQEATITSTSVSVMEVGGAVIPSKASFDPATNQVTIQLLAPLMGLKSYTVTLTTGIMDLNGNALSQNYGWQFFTVIANSVFLPIMIK